VVIIRRGLDCGRRLDGDVGKRQWRRQTCNMFKGLFGLYGNGTFRAHDTGGTTIFLLGLRDCR